MNLEAKAKQLRKDILDMSLKLGFGHISSCYSCAEICVALFYGGIMKEGDRFIMSKGHACPLLCAMFADKGHFPECLEKKFCMIDGTYGIHKQKEVPTFTATNASLGYGLGIAAGMALAGCRDKIYVMLGDGECYEGSEWESAMFISHHNLNNIVAIVDSNKLSATDWVENITSFKPFKDKWRAFGWYATEIDGHDFQAIERVLDRPGGPRVIIANTVKGKGIDFLNDPRWHGAVPEGGDIEIAKRCLL